MPYSNTSNLIVDMHFKDPDTEHDIHYILVRDMTDGRFEVDEFSGLFFVLIGHNPVRNWVF